MLYHEQECSPNNFYFGYLTILDFHIYEIVNYFTLLFPNEIVKFTKLRQIRDRVAALPEIKRYEESAYAVTEFCPIKYFKNYKEKKMSQSKQAQSRATDMDIER